MRRWRADEVEAFAARIRRLLEKLNWTPADLDMALRYAPQGKMTAQILGLYGDGHRRQPSVPYVQKFALLEAAPPPPKPPWVPLLLPYVEGEQGAVPLGKILAASRQCPECVAEFEEGRRSEGDTWWWFGHPCRRYCSGEHRKRWRRRERQSKTKHSRSNVTR